MPFLGFREGTHLGYPRSYPWCWFSINSVGVEGTISKRPLSPLFWPGLRYPLPTTRLRHLLKSVQHVRINPWLFCRSVYENWRRRATHRVPAAHKVPVLRRGTRAVVSLSMYCHVHLSRHHNNCISSFSLFVFEEGRPFQVRLLEMLPEWTIRRRCKGDGINELLIRSSNVGWAWYSIVRLFKGWLALILRQVVESPVNRPVNRAAC